MVEFALIVPVLAAVFVATFSISITSARALHVGAVSRTAGALAASGADLASDDGKRRVLDAARGLGFEKGDATIFITEISRDASGYRIVRQSAFGNAVRWKSAIQAPEGIVELEPGEKAWVTEVIAESYALGGIGPAELRARNVS